MLTQRGWGNEEALEVLRQARAVAERDPEPSDLGTILCALATVHEVRGEYRTSQELVERCLQLDQLPDQPVIESSELLACSLLHQGVFEDALQKAEFGSSRFGAIGPQAWVGSDGANPGVACHYWASLSLWFLGRPADSLARMRASLALAESLDRSYLRIAPELYAARLHHHRREPDEVIRHATVASALARQHGYGFHEAMSQILLAWADAMGGKPHRAIERVRAGLAVHDTAGVALDRPYCLGILAEVLCLSGRDEAAREAITEGLRQVGQHARSFFWESELHRMLGETLERIGSPPAEAEKALERAVEVARGQSARSLELRAVVSLFRFRRMRKKEEDLRGALERVYLGIREAGDSTDTVDAERLLAATG
jgi:tetratricopeptide (TPR) repeat protein